MTLTIGPKVTIQRSCFHCPACETQHYAIQGDSGCYVFCTAAPEKRKIGDSTWNTPEWCPAPAERCDKCGRPCTDPDHIWGLCPAPTPSPATTCKCGRYSLAPVAVLSHLDPYDRKHTATECPIPAPSEEPCPGGARPARSPGAAPERKE